jgi:hypothetical protein
MKRALLTIYTLCFFVLGCHAHPAEAASPGFFQVQPDLSTPGESDAALYPSPATDFIHVRLDRIDSKLSQNSEVELEVRNILGNIMPLTTERVDYNTIKIATSDFPSGYYLLIIKCGECSDVQSSSFGRTFKFLKQ